MLGQGQAGPGGRGQHLPRVDLLAHLSPILRCLAVFGMWPPSVYTSVSQKVAALTTGAATLSLFLMQLVAEVMALAASPVSGAAELYRFIYNFSVVDLHLQGMGKWAVMVARRRRYTALVHRLQHCVRLSGLADADYKNQQAAVSRLRQQLDDCRRWGVRANAVWLSVCVYGVTHWCLVPLLIGDNSLPFDALYLFSTDQPPLRQVAHCIQYVAGLQNVLLSVFFDLFVFWLHLLLCAQLRYLAGNLRRLRHLTDAAQYRRMLAACVAHHSHLLSTMQELNSCAGPSFFLQCFENTIRMCMIAFMATTTVADQMQVWSSAQFFLAAVAQLFLYCWCGQQLSHLAESISEAVYDSGWEDHDVSTQKTVAFIMWRAQKILVFKGGWFYTLTTETFVELIRLSFSYYTVLRNINDT
uniref:Odorant receptor n=1 Tax=Locusta migratoria TaxID=7004 RepID=A0A0M4J7G5_LOCMI|nr:odorant receptor 5 [Locusta migratoria]